MTKQFCDRCGKEIMKRKLFNPHGKAFDLFLSTRFETYGTVVDVYELCIECTNKLKRFLNGSEFIYG